MNCPQCTKPMKATRHEVTNNQQPGDDCKEYDKTVYWCQAEDIWVVVESPKQKYNQITEID